MRKALSIAAALIALFLIGARALGQDRTEPVPDQKKPVLAVIPLEADGVSENMSLQVTQALGAEFAALGGFELVPAERVEAAMNQHSGPCDAGSAIEIGRALGADKVIRGTLAREGRAYVVEVELLDVASGQTLSSLRRDECQAQSLPACLGSLARALSPPGTGEAVQEGGAGEAIAIKAFRKFSGGYPTGELAVQLEKLNSQKAMGLFLAIPSLIWAVGMSAAAVVGYIQGGVHAEYASIGFLVSSPGWVLGGIGLALVFDAQKGINLIEKQVRGGDFRLGLNFDPRQRLYGFSVSFAF